MTRTYEETVNFKPSRKAIIKLAQNSPIVHHCLMLWGFGDITFEEAMMTSVTLLVEQNNVLMEKLIEHEMHKEDSNGI